MLVTSIMDKSEIEIAIVLGSLSRLKMLTGIMGIVTVMSHCLLPIFHAFFEFLLSPHQTTNFLDWYKVKAFADNKINVTKKLKFVIGRVENCVGKGGNAGYQMLVSKGFFSKVVRCHNCVGNRKIKAYLLKAFANSKLHEKTLLEKEIYPKFEFSPGHIDGM